MRFIRLYILKFKLARIFKLAEQAVEQGRESGDQFYVELLAQANILLRTYEEQYPDYVEQIPAMNDLMKLTVPPAPVDYRYPVIAGLGAFVISAAVIASWGALVHVFYHLLVR
jgi:hypothetical protein